MAVSACEKRVALLLLMLWYTECVAGQLGGVRLLAAAEYERLVSMGDALLFVIDTEVLDTL